jgi:hypothetical protein
MSSMPRRVLASVVLGLVLIVATGGGAAVADTSSPSPTPSATASTPGTSSGGSAAKPLTFGIQPASATGPDARPFISWAATPGGYLTDHVALLNYSTQPLQVTVYPTDAFSASDGAFGLLPSNQAPSDAGSWIDVGGPKKVTVPARTANQVGRVILPVSATVPTDAVPGDHSAGILAVLTSLGRDKNGAQVKLEQRVGTRVFIRVSGDLTPKLTIANLHATYQGPVNPLQPGSVKMSYTLVNSGNANVSAIGSTTVSGLFGSRTVRGNPKLPVLLPGASVSVALIVPDVWPAVWMKGSVSVSVRPVAGDSWAAVPPATASTSFWAIPWGLLIILVLVALAVLAWWWQRRQARRVTKGAFGDGGRGKAKVEVGA